MKSSQQFDSPKEEGDKVLLQKDIRETIKILLSGIEKESLNKILFEIEKELKVKDLDILLTREQGNLFSSKENTYSENIFSLARHSIEKNKSFYINPHREDTKLRAWQRKFSNLGRAVLFVPIHLKQTHIGVLYAGEPLYIEFFTPKHLCFLQSFVIQFKKIFYTALVDKRKERLFFSLPSLLSLAENSFRYANKVSKLEERIASIMQVSNLIHSSSKTNELVQAILSSAQEVLSTKGASLFMLDKNTGEFYFEVLTGVQDKGSLVGKRIPIGEGIVSLCAKNKKPIIVNDAKKDKRVYHTVSKSEVKQVQNLMAAPLLIDGESIGVIEVINTLDGSGFTHEDLRLFNSFSESVAIAIQRRGLLDDLKKELRETVILHSVADVLVDADSPQKLFDQVLSIVEKFLGVRRLSILLYDRDKKLLKLNILKNAKPHTNWESIPSQLAEHVYAKGKSVMIEDLTKEREYQKFIKEDSSYKTNSCVLLVLKNPKESMQYGLFCLSDPLAGKFTENDFHLLSTVASELSRGYHSFLMEKKILEQKSIQKEIEIASQFQRDILPTGPLQHEYVEIGAQALMLNSVGGDLYYYNTKSPQDPVHLLIGDVSGKSIPAALFMAVSSSMLKTMIRSESVPAKILEKVNTLLFEESRKAMFLTLFLAYYEPKNGTLQYASAGHNQMLLLRADGQHEILSSKGFPLGVSGTKVEYLNKQTKVQTGDILALYTDGIIEAVNREKKEFGLDRLLDLLRKYKYYPPGDIVDKILYNLTDFRNSETNGYSDDLALLICKFKEPTQKMKKYSYSLAATKEATQKLLVQTEKIMLENDLDKDIQSDILLLIEEASVNIISYAYQDVEKKDPQFECSLNIKAGEKVVIEFKDEGKHYDFDSIKSSDVRTVLETNRAGGFGIRLIKSLADHVSYTHKEGKNFLRIDKKIN